MSYWILVIDDDTANLKIANRILSAENMRVSCLKSGEEALHFLQQDGEGRRTVLPDLILLDIRMPGLDGFQTIAALKENKDTAAIPVIFLTADEDVETELRGLSAGAMDFIKKPFIPEVLLLRVRNTVDLIRLQTDLSREVAKKTQEVQAHEEKLERMFFQIVAALSGAIDAKDEYTNGHSERVARYSREIAKRAGFSKEQQDTVFIMALLHDVGKIGIPDAILNKSSALTDEEYAVIKSHPLMGVEILEKIKDFPELLTGAKYHHERYDGLGYPDGIAGNAIPPEARIIAVADSYDAMTSRRRYRDTLSQDVVRREMEKGKGTQFDPVFTGIMIAMIDEDTEYTLKE